MEKMKSALPATAESASRLRSGRMKVTKRPMASLKSEEKDVLYAIYSSSYTNTQRSTFENDLKEKQFIFIGRDTGSKEIVGFSTLEVRELTFEKKKVTYFFSGDTMILPQYWGQTSLHSAFATAAALYKLTHPHHDVYWYLICMGYRTYLTMAKNFPTYFPRFDQATPAREKALLDFISTSRYGYLYSAHTGVITPLESTSLSSHVAPIDQEVLKVPQVAFLVKMNPGYNQGHEMACLGLLDLNMLTFFARKWLRKNLQSKIQLPAAWSISSIMDFTANSKSLSVKTKRNP